MHDKRKLEFLIFIVLFVLLVLSQILNAGTLLSFWPANEVYGLIDLQLFINLLLLVSVFYLGLRWHFLKNTQNEKRPTHFLRPKQRHLENAAIPTARINVEGEIFQHNQRWHQLLSTQMPKYTGKRLWPYLVDESREVLADALQQIIYEQKEYTSLEITLKGCQQVFCTLILQNEQPQHQSHYLTASLVNITEQKKAEEALLHSYNQLKSLLRRVSGIIWQGRILRDKTFQLHYISSGIEELTGHPAEYFYQSPARFWQLIHPEDKETWRKNNFFFFTQPGSHLLEYRLISIKKQYQSIRDILTIRKATDHQLQIDGIMNFLPVEASPTIPATTNLATLIENYAAILNNFPDGIAFSDLNGQIMYANKKSFIAQFSSPSHEIKQASIFDYIAEADLAAFSKLIQKIKETGNSSEIILKVKSENNAYYICEISASLISISTGKKIGLLYTMRLLDEIRHRLIASIMNRKN